ncbi:peptide/nickel transport system permease protein [Virgibacillus natechei]|uniref:Peptide/nickel transport system permease protein n=1 Tax=Virgibacillus natechei TaxID=1216297 RepID=A0ABS4IEQ6_9BACI|nr:ABC transporter permease [Virgibacillus natechei]MBP1969430.1 peptide/nickel transport system permease protein [Virgibacillus natechei]UZD11859.1 ABC transporter permease [Virgibacillus natechei]
MKTKEKRSEQQVANPAKSGQQLDTEEIEAISPWKDTLKQLRKNRFAFAGVIIIVFFICLGLFAPLLTSSGYEDQELANRLQSPSAEHWLGTDDLGRDIFTRIAYGARVSLQVGFFAVTGALVFGTLLGIVAGYFGRWIDMIISRIFDILLAFPSILLAIAVVAILGASLQNALIAIAIINIPIFGRLVRSKVISLREEEYIMAAKAQGMKNGRILLHHILPNSAAPIIVQSTLGFGTAILEAAALGFLGLGAQAPTPEWGKMLADSRDFIQLAPWTLIVPGVAIMLVVLGFNLIGDGLRDALDPKMKN